jgi:DNA polymerase-4
VDIAARLRAEVKERVGLPITVGIARTKFLAKVASGVAKPDGLLVVPVDGELAFLHPLPVEKLWGVGAKTAEKLHARGLRTVADVAALDERWLVAMLGPASGHHLHALAHLRDPRPVVVGRRRRSIGSQSALGRRRHTFEQLDERLMAIVDRVCRRLRKANRVCRTVVLRLRFDDMTKVTRSHTLPAATADTETILAALRVLLVAAHGLIAAQGITLIGVALANLDDANAIQLMLPFEAKDTSGLDAVLDAVRERYGSASVTRGVLLGKDPGIQVPLLPD